jgi:hypothetical protein
MLGHTALLLAGLHPVLATIVPLVHGLQPLERRFVPIATQEHTPAVILVPHLYQPVSYVAPELTIPLLVFLVVAIIAAPVRIHLLMDPLHVIPVLRELTRLFLVPRLHQSVCRVVPVRFQYPLALLLAPVVPLVRIHFPMALLLATFAMLVHGLQPLGRQHPTLVSIARQELLAAVMRPHLYQAVSCVMPELTVPALVLILA